MLAGICLVSSCDNLKGLKISQLDIKNKLVNQYEIVEVDKKKCALVINDLPTIELTSPEMHGAFCLSAKEFARYKKKLETECKNQQVEGVK